MSRLLLLAVLVVLVPGVAHAEKKVDWSQYLEKPGDRRPTPRATPTVAQPTAKKSPRATKAAKQRSAKIAATKAKAKAKAKAKKRKAVRRRR
jgi:hypothetical protein